MKHSQLVLSLDSPLREEIEEQLGAEHELIFCDSLADVERCLDASPVRTVVVHMCKSILGELSAGRFMSELNEVVRNAPIFAMVDPSCPARLRKLARGSADVLLTMPLDFARLNEALVQQSDLEAELESFWKGLPHKELHGQSRSMVTFTPVMFEMIDDLKVAARHDVTVLLIGATGSGKTYLARLIHELSERCNERFCTVSCGVLPPDLIESELFGYVKGAFTGADRDKEGKFAAAGNGTLLLDEIDVLPPDQQAKLLRVIETGEYEPVGSNKTEHSQARLVVASNFNLEELVQAGTFRTDLYYRLNILNFRLPPLFERPWDIEYLARKFALEHSRSHGIRLRGIEPAFLDALRIYHWPGNIREMENVIRRAVLYCQRGILSVSDLPSEIRSAIEEVQSVSNGAALAQPVANESNNNGDGHPPEPDAPVAERPVEVAAETDANLAARNDFFQGQPQSLSLDARLDILERRIIEDSLHRHNHRRNDTADELGISRVTLYNKMRKFGLLG